MKYIYPNDVTSGVMHIIVEDALADIWLNLARRENPDAEIIIKDAPQATIDLGGMMTVNAGTAEVVVDDGTLEIPLRHIEFALPRLRRRQTERYVDELGEYAFVRGQWTGVILTAATADRIADEFEAAAKARTAELEDEWTAHDKKCYELSDPEDPKAFIANRKQMTERDPLQQEKENPDVDA